CLFAPKPSTSRVVQSYPAQLSPKIAAVLLVLQSHLGGLSLPSSNLTPPLSLAPSDRRYRYYPSFQGQMPGFAHLTGDSHTMPPIPSNRYDNIQQLINPHTCYTDRQSIASWFV
ncbi:unnamed protein product, partial [Fusarium graminearum]